MEQFFDQAIKQWRERRDNAFQTHGLDLDEVYSSGQFDDLPSECLMAVCYVDAFQSAKASFLHLQKEKS